jgi:NAD(P)-dependent dehydrogenase (short-subunit alcohol dehydrogenase family)
MTMPDVAAPLFGKTALLTGAGREPLRAIALLLARQGARMALSDLTPMALDETAAAVRQAFPLAPPPSVHVSDPSKGLAARMLFEDALDAWDTLDILILYPHAQPRTRLLEIDEWDFQRTFETNVNGPFLMLQTAGNWMRHEGRAGVIVNLMAPSLLPPDDPAFAAYFASQAALNAFTRSAAREFAEYNIRVYGVCFDEPAPTDPGAVADAVAALCVPTCGLPPGSIVTV